MLDCVHEDVCINGTCVTRVEVEDAGRDTGTDEDAGVPGSCVDCPDRCGPGDECVECLDSTQCDAVGAECVDFRCVGGIDCELDAECGDSGICQDGLCTLPECNETADCAAGEVCVDRRCAPREDCRSDDECPADAYCSGAGCEPCAGGCAGALCVADGACAPCRDSSECAARAPSTPVCSLEDGRCQECTPSDASHCPSRECGSDGRCTTPTPEEHYCAACESGECMPGFHCVDRAPEGAVCLANVALVECRSPMTRLDAEGEVVCAPPEGVSCTAFRNVGQPCMSSSDCDDTGSDSGGCVPLEIGRSECRLYCSADDECPAAPGAAAGSCRPQMFGGSDYCEID